MAIYSFFIFDRHCNCIYNREWNQQEGTTNTQNNSDSSKLLFGAIFSLKNIASKLASSPDQTNYLKSFSTNKYRTHYLETATGLKFCLLTDPSVDDMQYVLREIYTNIYVENVVKNALCGVELKEGQYIENESFVCGVDNFVHSLSSLI